ncbi:hypothetical protein [Xenorhabdus sp. SGI246]|uniref:hypothetical protein n=1 Tax=Xenorhabdus sp. SGI246 TaxID=3158263 RepID=UPI00349FC11C
MCPSKNKTHSKPPYVSAPIPYVKNIKTTLRWDSRPPVVISKVGFQGSGRLYFNNIFGYRTVFCSSDLRGAQVYFKELENGMSKYSSSGIYYLYEINALGVPAVRIYGNKGNLGFNQQFATRDPYIEEKIIDKEYGTLDFSLISRFSNYIENFAEFSHEIQLLGPISPHRILFLDSRTFRTR